MDHPDEVEIWFELLVMWPSIVSCSTLEILEVSGVAVIIVTWLPEEKIPCLVHKLAIFLG